MAYTTIDNPEEYFQCKIYTGDGNTGRSITFDNTETSLQPDLAWFKNRDDTDHHGVVDSVRGVTKRISSNATFEEQTDANNISAFNSNGFSISASAIDNMTNTSGEEYVFWCWKGGTTSVPSGSTSDPTGVSYNATSGFGIYKITAPGSGNYVLKHGLGTTPNFIWVKDLDATQKHMIWVDQFSNLTDDYLQLNSNAAKATYSTCWGTMNTTDATIATGGTLDVNNDHVIYVFSNRQGFQKHGSYTGNGNANGTFVYTGFRPAWIMIKGNRADNWQIMDNKRDVGNVCNTRSEASTATAEYTNINMCDFLSNGFKIRNDDSSSNESGTKYFYMAFAEAPFVNSNGVPCNAR